MQGNKIKGQVKFSSFADLAMATRRVRVQGKFGDHAVALFEDIQSLPLEQDELEAHLKARKPRIARMSKWS